MTKLREIIKLYGWITGSGYSWADVYSDRIVDIEAASLPEPEDMDYDWYDVDELNESNHDDVKIEISYYIPDDDIDECGPIEQYHEWQNNLIKKGRNGLNGNFSCM